MSTSKSDELNGGPLDYPRLEHTPPEYSDYTRYKPYLRDEFRFTCVYCMIRETWLIDHFYLGVEHFLPKSEESYDCRQYSNLLYSCNKCNHAKGPKRLDPGLHPEANPYGEKIEVERDGTLSTESPAHQWLIDVLNLNRESMRLFRVELQNHWNLCQELIQKRPEREPELMQRYRWPHDAPTMENLEGAVRPYATRKHKREWF